PSGLHLWISGPARGGFDGLAFGQAHVSLADTGLATGAEAEHLQLALDVGHVHRHHVHVEHLLDRGLDVGLGGIGCHREYVLVVLGQPRALFGDVGRTQRRQNTLVGSRLAAHDSHSSIFFTASTVMTTWSAAVSATGLMPSTSMTSMTLGLLRADRNSFSSTACVTIRVRPLASIWSSLPISDFVFGASTANSGTTLRRPWRFSSASIEHSAPRYILRLTFCAKSRGCAANARAPPTKIGAR